MRLDGVQRVAGCELAPQFLDEAIRRYNFPGVQSQQSERGSLQVSARSSLTVVCHDEERAQKAHPHIGMLRHGRVEPWSERRQQVERPVARTLLVVTDMKHRGQ